MSVAKMNVMNAKCSNALFSEQGWGLILSTDFVFGEKILARSVIALKSCLARLGYN